MMNQNLEKKKVLMTKIKKIKKNLNLEAEAIQIKKKNNDLILKYIIIKFIICNI